uniref:Carcinoembryonic antigen-related cell adhesion molecule 18-like n=1 Tax=Gouania willdenowi TaxID=441366 RepID=A0A8C5EL23_GOUWI
MKALLLVGTLFLIHGCCAFLFIKGPTEPVLEGNSATLECMSTDYDFNTSQVHFEVLSKYRPVWHKVQESRWCYYSMVVERTDDSLILSIPHATTYYEGSYRCVSNADNSTDAVNSSIPLAFKVHYMGDVYVIMESYSRFLGIPEVLKVRRGDSVELKCSVSSSEKPNFYWHKKNSDWFLPSSTLTLTDIDEFDEGDYTCMVEHSVKSLSRKRTISIKILPENARWHETSHGRILLMTTSAAGALVVFIVCMTVFLCRRAKQAKTTKGPIDDHSQKKPIYKTSVEQ